MAKSLLRGEVLSIMNCFKWFGVTNCPREIGRSIEREFGVEVSRVKKDFISRYGQSGYYYEYRLNRTEHNKNGISKMEAYIKQIDGKEYSTIVNRGPKTSNPKKEPPSAKDLFTNN